MPFDDRIQNAAYISPSGERFDFVWEEVEKEIVKKTTAFEFPDVEGTYIQDLGKSGRRYPLRIIFWGADYDLVAERFDSALEEKGPGRLLHPFYGEFQVVPTGTIRRRDDLKNAANQVVYDVTFWETIDIVFPTSAISARKTIENELLAFEVNVGEFFDRSLSLQTDELVGGVLSVQASAERVDFIAAAKAAIRKIKRDIAKLAATFESINRKFNDAYQILDDSINILVGTPIELARQIINLIKLPASAETNIKAKLWAYQTLLNSFVGGTENRFTSNGVNFTQENRFVLNNLIASAVITSQIESVLTSEAEFNVRSQIIDTIESLEASLSQFQTWDDENREILRENILYLINPGTNELIDTGEAYQNMLSAFSLSIGRLTEIVFTALQERSVILTEGRSLIDFASEFYAEIDPVLDPIIQINDLTGIEILIEIPKGREMIYYV